MKKSVLDASQVRRRRQKNLIRGILSGVGLLLIIGIIAAVGLTSPQVKLLGDPVIIKSRNHVAMGTDPGPYPANPPAGGLHFEETFNAGFYIEDDLSALPVFPEGYLVHNLEHGYIIFWYNCDLVEGDCSNLMNSIRMVMAESGKTKLIAFPWSTSDVPLAMTSWGRILRFSSVDIDLMQKFVLANYDQAPEPEAD